MASVGPDYSVWMDLPGSSRAVVRHVGRAALPAHVLGVSSFTKAFFQRGDAGEQGGEEVFGRVVHPTPLGDWVYPGPMYFRCRVGSAEVPREFVETAHAPQPLACWRCRRQAPFSPDHPVVVWLQCCARRAT